MINYLILGAGPAGLSIANRLLQLGETSILVLEKENEAGGLCRSREIDGAPFDIGGGHFLDVKRQNVNQFLFSFLPEREWNKYERDSKIQLKNIMINSPIEANIWQMELDEQIEYLKSIFAAGCNCEQLKPNKFVDWIYWKLGDKIAEEYMLPYNSKMFGDDLNELGTYWLDKLPDVSFEDTLLSCLTRKMYGSQPAHTQFYYPKNFGYGELWNRMAKRISDKILFGECVQKIDFENKTIETQNKVYKANIIITTIPWKELKQIIGLPVKLRDTINQLKHSSIETRYFPENINSDAQWIYYPDMRLPYHRILIRHNFFPSAKGYWTETRKERVNLFPKQDINHFSYMNEYAYPLNTINKNEIMQELLSWCRKKGVYGLGRWGEHQHYNSDVVVEKALIMAEMLYKGIE